jgi:hypothetical protein
LIAEFVLRESAIDAATYGRPAPFYTVNYDFVLATGQARAEVKFSAGRA